MAAGPFAGTLVTGAAGQLGHSLLEVFPEAKGLTRADWDVTLPPPESLRSPSLVLHAAACNTRSTGGRPGGGGNETSQSSCRSASTR